jgi:glycosyltransferase involved in cell wall biosynthesis
MKQPDRAYLSVVIPAFNEESTLAVVKKLLELPHLLDVVIVDDCSRDQMAEIAQSLAAADSIPFDIEQIEKLQKLRLRDIAPVLVGIRHDCRN